MKNIFLSLSLLLCVIFIFFGMKLFSNSKELRLSITDIDNGIIQQEAELELLSTFKITAKKSLNDNYETFLNFIRLVGKYHKIKFVVSLIGVESGEDFINGFKESRFKGVKILKMEINFSGIKKKDLGTLFRAFDEMQIEKSVEILEIISLKNSIKVILNLYGI